MNRTIRLTRNVGAQFRTMPDATGRRYLTITIWIPAAGNLLRYFYPCFRIF